jgi:hypothetical protein
MDAPDAAALDRAQALLEVRPESALPILRDLFGRYPDSFAVALVLARALIVTEQWQEAEQVAQTAVDAHPDSPDGFRLLALALANQRRLVPAKAAANAAARLAPQDWRSFYALAQVDVIVGGVGRYSINNAGHAVHLNPTIPDSHVLFGDTLYMTGHLTHARAAYEAALAIDPTHTGAQMGTTAVQMSTGKWSASGAGMASILALDPQLDIVKWNLLVPFRILLWRLAYFSIPLSLGVMAAISVGPWLPPIAGIGVALFVWWLSRPFTKVRRAAAVRGGMLGLLSRWRRRHVIAVWIFLGLTVVAWLIGWIANDPNVSFRLLVIPTIGTAVLGLITLWWVNE